MAKLRWLPWLLFALLAVDAFVPLTPFMPREDLDAAWMFGLNQAVAQHLAFGRDLVFTFGPYASIFIRTYDPAVVTRMLAGSALLALTFLVCMAVLLRQREGRWPALACCAAALLLSGADSLLLMLPLLLGLVLLSLPATPSARWHGGVMALAFAALGLLPLVKGTLALLCAAIALLCAVAALQQRRWWVAVLCATGPLLALVVFWLLAGQALPDLPLYVANLKQVVSGYSEAMALDGLAREIVLFLLPAVLLPAALLTQGTWPRPLRLALLAANALFLFVSFKAGFVRHDHHAHIALANLLFAVGLLWPVLPPSAFRSRAPLWTLVASTVLCGVYLANRARLNPALVAGGTSNPLTLRTSGFDPAAWPVQFSAAKQQIASRCGLQNVPRLRTDIYAYEQSCLLAAGLPWQPRPVLQSYSAYTPALARLNENHLRGADAPQQLLYRLQTIDGRLPALDDGVSLPAMLDNYTLADRGPHWLRLLARPTTVAASRYEALGSVQAQLGQAMTVPPSLPIFTEITIRPTLWGRLLALLYKPPRLFLQLTLADGRVVTQRVHANMMESGFLLSPWLSTNDDVAALFDGTLPAGPAVRSLSLVSASAGPFWHTDYNIRFQRYLPRSP